MKPFIIGMIPLLPYMRYLTHTRLIEGLELKEAEITRFGNSLVRLLDSHESIQVLSVAVADNNMEFIINAQ